ncbi:hypothetical protein FPOAC2_13293 [Fusarium poae]
MEGRTNSKLHLWLEDKGHTIEGHDSTCTLYYKDQQVWGPVSCHSNTWELSRAIQDGDPHFELIVKEKGKKTQEGHRCSISVESKGKTTLNKLSTHENMKGLVDVIEAIEAIEE